MKEEKAAAQQKELKDSLEAAEAKNQDLLNELKLLRAASKEPGLTEVHSMRRRHHTWPWPIETSSRAHATGIQRRDSKASPEVSTGE